MLNRTHCEAQKSVDRAHPFCIATGQIIVHRDEVYARSLERIEIDRERRDESLPLPGLHFGDLASMENNATQDLHVVVAQADGPTADFTDHRKGLGKDIFQGLARLERIPEFLRLGFQAFIRKWADFFLKFADLRDNRLHSLELTLVLTADDLGENRVQHARVILAPAGH